MTPLLYHWIGRPDKSGCRVREIIARHYSDSPAGLPGNDDAGAMSSWLVFNMAGIYPNAGHDYYLIHTPVLGSITFTLADGKKFRIVAEGLTDRNIYIAEAYLNGVPHPGSALRHADLAAGGELRLVMADCPSGWGKSLGLPRNPDITRIAAAGRSGSVIDFSKLKTPVSVAPGDTLAMEYKLHGQTRRFRFVYQPDPDGGMTLSWNIVRNLKLWTGSYRMSAKAVKEGETLSTLMPEDGNHVALPDGETFAIISRKAYDSLVRNGEFQYGGVTYRKVSDPESMAEGTIEVSDCDEGARMLILDNPEFPLIVAMDANPLEINWKLN